MALPIMLGAKPFASMLCEQQAYPAQSRHWPTGQCFCKRLGTLFKADCMRHNSQLGHQKLPEPFTRADQQACSLHTC